MKIGPLAGKIIPLLFQWLAYGASTATPNINVLVDIDNATTKSFDQIRSIYIDNLGSPNPVYVYFPDTQYTISAKANSEGWYPAYTNARKIWVIGEGFLTGEIPQTLISLTNIPLPPNVNTEFDQAAALYLASPLIARGTSIYNTDFGTPSLGDQFSLSASLNLATVGNTVGLWGTPYPSGFLYINSLFINVVAISASNTTGSFSLSIESTGAAGVLATPTGFVFPLAPPGNINMFGGGANVKLDATQTWRARVVGNSNIFNGSAAQVMTAFTQQ